MTLKQLENKLNKFLAELYRGPKSSMHEYIEIPEVNQTEGEEPRIYANLYTDRFKYRISATPTYLGCTLLARKPRAGEDWFRGADLADGDFSKKTWEKIKSDIIMMELVKLVRIEESNE